MYGLMRALLFRLPPEQAHHVALSALDLAARVRLLPVLSPSVPELPVEVMGVRFSNPVGLAAGLDKDGDHIDALGALGFGFLEIGTVTPLAQPGNPRPRMFRLPEHRALINRMGFNNQGLAHLLANVERRRWRGVLGINVGKNAITPVAEAAMDYRRGIAAVYGHADYLTVNVSSPNTPGLRDLQFGDSLKQLLVAIKEEQQVQARAHGRYVPVAVKIAPDLDEQGIRFIAAALLETGLDGVIASNTTIARGPVSGHRFAEEAGGLSGAPLAEPSLAVIRGLKSELGDRLPIIGVGGILEGRDALDKIEAGASLVQIYTGFIYRGPALISESVRAIAAG